LADEWSVDVDDSRETPSAAGRARAPVVAAGSRLAPVQEAWSDYVVHSGQCGICRAVDGTACPTAEGLYRTYRQLARDGMGEVWRD
jgi:hypothetical protein